MKSDACALPWQCLTAALFASLHLVSADAASAAPVAPTSKAISCATPDMWTGEARTSMVVSDGRGDDGSYAPPPVQISYAGANDAQGWSPVFKSDGASRLRGAARARVLSYGVLWLVEPAALGVTEAQAISALLRSGAVIARREGDGRVYFRAREADYQGIASRAATLLGVSGKGEVRKARSSTAKSVPAAMSLNTLGVDVAMMRMEGRYSSNPIEFIESMPGGMSVMPFGTSYVVHVPSSLVNSMWDALDGEGRRVLLVGASSPLLQGMQAAQAIQYCGGSALMRRFPTPSVARQDGGHAVLEVESQRMSVTSGDIVLVVQAPPYGRGIEIALMRFGKR